MPTSPRTLDRLRYRLGHLFGPWEGEPALPEPKKRRLRPVKRPTCASGHDSSLCTQCRKRKSQQANPRSVMSVDQAVETVRGILINRLDSALSDLTRIALTACEDLDAGTAEQIAIRFIQTAQVRLFPDEFGDGPEYTPNPAGRMDGVAVNPLGLVPRLPTVAIYARHLEAGQRSPIAGMTDGDGARVFTDAELARLGERQERRSAPERNRSV